MMNSPFASKGALKAIFALLPEEGDKEEWLQIYREENEEVLTKFKVKVVGLQHYSGIFHGAFDLF